eukprot:scaffold25871_cov19-Prasinocladus_malaysianus.AAC.2
MDHNVQHRPSLAVARRAPAVVGHVRVHFVEPRLRKKFENGITVYGLEKDFAIRTVSSQCDNREVECAFPDEESALDKNCFGSSFPRVLDLLAAARDNDAVPSELYDVLGYEVLQAQRHAELQVYVTMCPKKRKVSHAMAPQSTGAISDTTDEGTKDQQVLEELKGVLLTRMAAHIPRDETDRACVDTLLRCPEMYVKYAMMEGAAFLKTVGAIVDPARSIRNDELRGMLRRFLNDEKTTLLKKVKSSDSKKCVAARTLRGYWKDSYGEKNSNKPFSKDVADKAQELLHGSSPLFMNSGVDLLKSFATSDHQSSTKTTVSPVEIQDQNQGEEQHHAHLDSLEDWCNDDDDLAIDLPPFFGTALAPAPGPAPPAASKPPRSPVHCPGAPLAPRPHDLSVGSGATLAAGASRLDARPPAATRPAGAPVARPVGSGATRPAGAPVARPVGSGATLARPVGSGATLAAGAPRPVGAPRPPVAVRPRPPADRPPVDPPADRPPTPVWNDRHVFNLAMPTAATSEMDPQYKAEPPIKVGAPVDPTPMNTLAMNTLAAAPTMLPRKPPTARLSLEDDMEDMAQYEQDRAAARKRGGGQNKA